MSCWRVSAYMNAGSKPFILEERGSDFKKELRVKSGIMGKLKNILIKKQLRGLGGISGKF